MNNKSTNKYLILCILFCLVITVFGACSGKKVVGDINGDTENVYTVYYLNSARNELVSEKVILDITGKTTQNLIDELVELMRNPVNVKYASAVPKQLDKLDRALDRQILSVYFSNEYTNIPVSEEVLFRTAYVLTVTQLSQVEYVSFYVDNQPLKDAYGNAVGIMLASDFVLDMEYANSMLSTDIPVYYGTPDGSSLDVEVIRIVYGKNASLEETIINQLIKGPDEDDHVATLSPDVTLLSVTTKDGICYANFDSSFVSLNAPVSANITIYSIVNSLCELQNVSKVQFLFSGDNNISYQGIDLKMPLERNLDLINN